MLPTAPNTPLHAHIHGDWPLAMLAQVEDAGLNASAPPQQRWMDGWLLRTNPGKAQRARCVNAVALGVRPWADKLAECEAAFAAVGVPALVRITPFTHPADLGDLLATRRYVQHDDTLVMVCPDLPKAARHWPQHKPTPTPEAKTNPRAGALDSPQVKEHDLPAYARIIGTLRGSPQAAITAHAQRLGASPVPYRAFSLRAGSEPNAPLLACGQIATEGPLVGLYDVATAPTQQRQGHGQALCQALLHAAMDRGAHIGYLQVGADNTVAQHLYGRLGFHPAYRYHYRLKP